MTITHPEHVDQDAERALRAVFHEDIKAGRLSIAEAVVAMRRISRLTPGEFAEHRGVDLDELKQIESGAADPIIATLNQIASIFGLEVGLMPKRKASRSRDCVTSDQSAEILQQAHEACLALSAYRRTSLDDFNALGYDGLDKVTELATDISYSAEVIASILTESGIAERNEIRKLATLYGDRERGGSLTARCLHHYVTQQVPELETALRGALERVAPKLAPKRSLAQALGQMPDVGEDKDFER